MKSSLIPVLLFCMLLFVSCIYCQCESCQGCDEGFQAVGEFCEPVCYDVVASEIETVCSGHGSCESPNNCSCQNGWTSEQCETRECLDGFTLEDGECVPVCFDYPASSACSGHGTCFAPDRCRCQSGWSGDNCETQACEEGHVLDDNDECIPLCYGFAASQSCCVCSGHGTCSGPDTCECSEGYIGDKCETKSCDEGYVLAGEECVPTCFGTPANETCCVCTGHGNCSDIDTCECAEGWTGDQCETKFCEEGYVADGEECVPICFGRPANETCCVCSGHGSCTAPDTCECSEGYFFVEGEGCVPTCFGTPANETCCVCTGHGNCSDVDACSCEPGWSGENCETRVCDEGYVLVGEDCLPTCFGTPANETCCVCTGHGNCSDVDTCSCEPGWSGENCETKVCDEGYVLFEEECIPVCFGTPANETCCVCTGHGNCSDVDTCSCEPGWSGENCGTKVCDTGFVLAGEECIPVCFGFPANETCCVCSRHGSCIDANTCDCIAEWTGRNCETKVCERGFAAFEEECIPICYGIISNETCCVCNGHGVCSAPDFCVCNEGFLGPNCSIVVLQCDPGYVSVNNEFCSPICFGINGTDTDLVCNGKGNCSSPDVCTCAEGWTGEDCTIPICYEFAANDTCCVCSGNGECVDYNVCNCKEGWEGDECQTRVCDTGYVNIDNECVYTCHGIPHTNETACNGFGNCSAIDQCECYDRHFGPQCESCVGGWTGVDCDVPICYDRPGSDDAVCSGHGICENVNECVCYGGYIGERCELPTCYGIPANETKCCSSKGTCIAVNTCQCQQGWSGPSCQTPVCDSPCYNGFCIGPNTCTCRNGYEGPTCSDYRCNDVLSTEPSVCTGHGQCIRPNVCVCSDLFAGEDCQYPICFHFPSNDTRCCSSHGACREPERCQCAEGWTGPLCDSPNCGCGRHGICVESERDKCNCRCKCRVGWGGPKCNNAVCRGAENGSPICCSGRGNCYSPERCKCKSGFRGKNCEKEGEQPTFTCFGIDPDDPRVCGGNGVCAKRDTCCCYFGYSGRRCECTYKKTTVCPASDDSKCTCRFGGRFWPGTKQCLCTTPTGIVANTTKVCANPNPTPRSIVFDKMFMTTLLPKQQHPIEDIPIDIPKEGMASLASASLLIVISCLLFILV